MTREPPRPHHFPLTTSNQGVDDPSFVRRRAAVDGDHVRGVGARGVPGRGPARAGRGARRRRTELPTLEPQVRPPAPPPYCCPYPCPYCTLPLLTTAKPHWTGCARPRRDPCGARRPRPRCTAQGRGRVRFALAGHGDLRERREHLPVAPLQRSLRHLDLQRLQGRVSRARTHEASRPWTHEASRPWTHEASRPWSRCAWPGGTL